MLVEQAYQVFSKHRVAIPLDVCKVCCVSDEEERMLASRPLKQLSSTNLSIYIHSARCYSEKEQREMLYFIPRVLELLVNSDAPGDTSSILLDRLFDKEGKVFIGNEAEYEFLSKFLREYWIMFVNQYEYIETINEVLEMIGKHFSLQPMLNIWQHSKSAAAVMHFADYITYCPSKDPATGRVHEELRQWMQKPLVKKHFLPLLEAMYLNETFATLVPGTERDEKIAQCMQLTIESAYNLLYTL